EAWARSMETGSGARPLAVGLRGAPAGGSRTCLRVGRGISCGRAAAYHGDGATLFRIPASPRLLRQGGRQGNADGWRFPRRGRAPAEGVERQPGPGAERGLPAAKLFSTVALELAGCHQGDLPRPRLDRRGVRGRGPIALDLDGTAICRGAARLCQAGALSG